MNEDYVFQELIQRRNLFDNLLKNKEDREDRCTGSYRQAVREIPSITKNDSSQWILIITADNIASIIQRSNRQAQTFSRDNHQEPPLVILINQGRDIRDKENDFKNWKAETVNYLSHYLYININKSIE